MKLKTYPLEVDIDKNNEVTLSQTMHVAGETNTHEIILSPEQAELLASKLANIANLARSQQTELEAKKEAQPATR